MSGTTTSRLEVSDPDGLKDLVTGLPWKDLPYGAMASLARECAVAQSTVSKWRDGHVIPSRAYWLYIEDLFDLDRGALAAAASAAWDASGAERSKMRAQLRALEAEVAGLLERIQALADSF